MNILGFSSDSVGRYSSLSRCCRWQRCCCDSVSQIYLTLRLLPGGRCDFDNLALIFAIGVASSWSKDSAGAAALAGAVGYFVLTKAMVTINPEINMGVLAGIITGLVGGAAYNRWSDIKLPDFLSFFGGKRFVPIATGFFCPVLAAILVTSGRRYSTLSMQAASGSFLRARWVPVSLVSSTVC